MDGIAFYTEDVRWGGGDGLGTDGLLTALQVDENFYTLLTRLQALEDNPPEAISVSGFTVIGSQFEVNMSDGSTRGPYTLPIATFNMQGNWVNSMPLAVLDMFTVPHQGLFLTLVAHTTPASPAEFDPDAIDEDSGSPTFGQPLYQKIFGEDTYIYDLGFFYPGQPGLGIEPGEEMFGHAFIRPCRLLATAPGSVGKLKTQAAAAMEFKIQKNAVDIGTVNFAIAGLQATFTVAADVDFAIGDVLAVLPPTAGQDATAKGFKLSLLLQRTDLA